MVKAKLTDRIQVISLNSHDLWETWGLGELGIGTSMRHSTSSSVPQVERGDAHTLAPVRYR